MNKQQLLELCDNSQWERIVYFAANSGIQNVLEAEILGKSYRMLGQYDLAIKVFELGSNMSVDGFWKCRFEIQICDCMHLQGLKVQADSRLNIMDSMYKVKDSHLTNFVLGWRDLQLAKYEEDIHKRLHLLSMSNVQLDASEVVGEYDMKLKRRLQVTVLQQCFLAYKQLGNTDLAKACAYKAIKIAEDANLEYDRVSNLGMLAWMEKESGNIEKARELANEIIKANLTDRMVKEAYKLLEELDN